MATELEILNLEIKKWREMIDNKRPARDVLIEGPLCRYYDSSETESCPNCPLREINQDPENDSSSWSQIISIIREDEKVISFNSDRASLAEYDRQYPGLKRLYEKVHDIIRSLAVTTRK